MGDKKKENYDLNMETARITRKHFDKLKGLSKTKGAQRGDFPLCRRLDKCLIDAQNHKNPEDRKKIFAEYHGLQKEARKYG